ncbi:chaperone protein dnaJ C76, chloroplastic [Coffea eugenioides]|uniref:chaperone protein dnaJ C76, chloroplastic n=1 Tax=Coffea eugenioides TaxID=49369 RepID=UPI000F60E1F9|nr:chaperone protein dnaJ C76, chloroplastic [Coffea eugenioides]
MESSLFCNQNAVGNLSKVQETVKDIIVNRRNSPSTCSFPSALTPPTLKTSLPFLSSFSSCSFRLNCYRKDDEHLSTSLAYDVLGLAPDCTPAELKAAFRAKVKEYHPDVRQDKGSSDMMIRRVIKAYEILSNCSRSEIIERECMDPFDEPECEAFDVFVNEVLCVGKGCPYSCVKRAPHAFEFSSLTGTARATSQGHGKDYQVQSAVGQCPMSCIYFVTPSQRIILEELLDSIIGAPYDTSAEADLLYSLIVKAKFENNRYRKPKQQPKVSTKHVDWF